jgi:hypothetical protein
MKKAASLNWLIPVIILLAVTAALFGLFSGGGTGAYAFTTLHGQAAQIYGSGLYRFDTVFSAATFRAVDLITLCLSVPLLVLAFVLYQQGRLRGALLLISAIPYFLYNGASMTFGAMFNSMFLVYVALFSASLFAFMVALTTIDPTTLPERVLPRLPRRGIAIFLFIAGIGTLFLWLSELIGPLLSGEAPANLGPYTTMFTHGFDSAIITPATIVTGIWLMQRKPLGYILAAPLMVFCIQNGITVIGATISQTMAGIIFPIGVYVGMVGSWVVMGAFAIWLSIRFFRNISETAR